MNAYERSAEVSAVRLLLRLRDVGALIERVGGGGRVRLVQMEAFDGDAGTFRMGLQYSMDA